MSKKLEELRKIRNSINMTVTFEEEINYKATNLFVANHNLLKDIFYLPMATDCDMVSMISPRLLYKNDLPRKDVVNKYLYGLPIEAHGGPNYANMCLNMGSALLQTGISVGIFPEGAYIEEDEIHKGRTGAVRMLFSSLDINPEINLIPVAISTTKEKDHLDDFNFDSDFVEVKVLKPIEYMQAYKMYLKTNDRDERNFYLHQVTDEAMRNIASSINKTYIDKYIELFKKNNVMFGDGQVVSTDIAGNLEYLNLYYSEISNQTDNYIKILKK